MRSGRNGSTFGTFMIIGTAVAGFSSFVYRLFGDTIPSVFWMHLKEAGAALIMLAVFVFAVAWLLKAKPHNAILSRSLISLDKSSILRA